MHSFFVQYIISLVIKMAKITCNTKSTKEVRRDLNRDHFKIGTKVVRVIINILTILIVLVQLSSIFLTDLPYTMQDAMMLALMLVMQILLNTNIFADISTKHFLKTDKLSLDLESVYNIDDETIEVINEKQTMKLKYDELFKVVETKKYIYLYINKMQALILTKETMKEKDVKAFVTKLKSLDLKYIEKKK